MAGNRCESCGKMVGLETGEPEIENEDLHEGQVAIDVHLTRNCADCSTEMKEITFNLEADHSDELKQHELKEHFEVPQEYTLNVTSTPEATESGGGRYAKNMIGVDVDYTITCDGCDEKAEPVVAETLHDEAAASAFDEI